jgi:hypothetical protein
VESDPIGLSGGSYSTYSYVGNRPLSAIDPFGLMSICRMGSSYFDCGAEPPSPAGSCEQAMMAGPYIVGWMPCSTAPPPAADCGSGNSNNSYDDPFSPLVPHVPAVPQLASTSSPWGASTGLGGSIGGFDLFGCTASASAGTGGLSGYGGCGVGLGGLASRWRWQNSLGFGNPTGWGLNAQVAGGAFGGAGSLSIFLTTSGASATVSVGNGAGGTGNVTIGYRGNQ